ncbi:MAG: phospho-N-acetylmuramoyl-pentapeptide-transferase [Clostridia bacterium]|nr:phospho-N-acetylmuramoyl-pentapeptide-transferase [Clostridia bacterium]
MQRLIWTVIAAFAMTVVLGPVFIPWLKKLKFGQTIYDLGPESHKKKQGTPTMGGIIFAIPALVAALAFSYAEARCGYVLMIAVSALGFGLIGFVDDFIKVKLKRSLGLTPKQKLVPQIILSAGLAVWAYLTPSIRSTLTIPFFNVEWDLGWVYIPVMMFILVGTVNSANLLDGLDGLLAGCSMIDFIAMMFICITMAAVGGADRANLMNCAIFAGAMVGALMSFLRFNGYPARVFMGDVGSFFIGGALVGLTMVTRLSLLLPVIALAIFESSLSDIIQVGYFKYTKKKYGAGRRVFKMAPLHHHFELSGMPETRIVTMYYIATAALCLLAMLGFVA